MHEYELQADAEFVFKKTRRARRLVFCADCDRARTPTTRTTTATRRRWRTATSCSSTTRRTTSTTSRTSRACFRPTAVHAPAARDVRDLLALYQARDDVDPGAQDAGGRASRTAVVKMDAMMASYTFTDAKNQGRRSKRWWKTTVAAVRRREASATTVGLEVHDVGGAPGRDARARPCLHHRAARSASRRNTSAFDWRT